ncbi:hypothetical protein K0040_12255 [Terrisporobacter petrolearius]|uniref:hypothetical protein n=1 Tax=Terrisporobacter petrolearius TaxID=1460447 RepID=UPI001D169B01|nr:hypothetical protein [Terrisporobacter petrolearius]MCC3865045.1 hypothetical protein [Terrisporobacter petrolearius]
MRKAIICLLIFSITFTSMGFNLNKVYGQNFILESSNQPPVNKEKGYLSQLQSISNQLDILAANILDKITSNEDKTPLIKDASFIKSQIEELRLELLDYHKTESGDIEQTPISAALLNSLNFYSMSLSYLLSVIEATDSSSESKALQYYYTNKSFGDSMLLWIEDQLNEE